VTAVFFGTFNSAHAANALLLDDLRAAGVDVRLCHEPLWQETRDKDARYFSPAGLARLGARYLRAAFRLTRRFAGTARGATVAVAGFNGQLDVILLRRLARGRRIVFAPLVSITETLIDDRASYAEGGLAARVLRALDRLAFRSADLVVIDTAAHRDYLEQRLGVPHERILVQYLGAESLFCAAPEDPLRRAAPAPRLRVLFYGQYLPLHGTGAIAGATEIVSPDEGIEFELIGTGPERAACDARTCELPHVKRTDWVPYEELPLRIQAADVVLGIFGRSAKARMVVPNKIYQAAQVGRAIVTADTPAVREVFAPGESIELVEPEAEAIAAALRALAADPARRARLGEAARAAVARAAGAPVRAARLAAALASLFPAGSGNA
jgi:glycosyltransferase involved in cell wall biosynthesis